MDATHTRNRYKRKSRQQQGLDRISSDRAREELDKGWQVLTERFEAQFEPDLWVTLETIKEMPYKRGKRLVRAFWSMVCRKYKCHAEIMMFSDQQPNSTYTSKNDYHHIVKWIDGEVPSDAIAKLWQAFLMKRIFSSNKRKKIDINDIPVRDYVADIQPYKKKNENHSYNHCLRYAWTGHEWYERFVACPNTGQCKHKGCKFKLDRRPGR
jgi:hypothetical protein